MFWVWLARTWLQSGLGSHDGLTVGVMLFCSIMSCSETLLRVFPSLWVNLQLNSGQTVEKRWEWIKTGNRQRGNGCIQTTEWHTSPRPVFQLWWAQDHSQRRLMQTMRQKKRGESVEERKNSLYSMFGNTKKHLKQSPQWKHFTRKKASPEFFWFLPTENQ